jgi:hypothetical protein
VQRAGDVGALQPGGEQPGAAADARAVGDPGVEQVLMQVAQLELLGVQPAGEVDRLANQFGVASIWRPPKCPAERDWSRAAARTSMDTGLR